MLKALRIILALPEDLWSGFIGQLPGSIGYKLRFWYWRRKLGALGKGSLIGRGVHFEGCQHIFIGEKTWIDHHVILIAGSVSRPRKTRFLPHKTYTKSPGELHIGDRCHIAPFSLLNGLGGIQIEDLCGVASGCKLYSYSHHYRDLEGEVEREFFFTPMAEDEDQYMISAPIVMQRGAALGLNSIVLPGVTIGRGSWIGTGTTLIKDIPEQSIYTSNGQTKPRKR